MEPKLIRPSIPDVVEGAPFLGIGDRQGCPKCVCPECICPTNPPCKPHPNYRSGILSRKHSALVEVESDDKRTRSRRPYIRLLKTVSKRRGVGTGKKKKKKKKKSMTAKLREKTLENKLLKKQLTKKRRKVTKRKKKPKQRRQKSKEEEDIFDTLSFN